MNRQPTSGNPRSSRLVWPQLAFTALLLLVAIEVRAERVARESDLKATLLFNFSHFTEWPARSLGPTNAPFVIGIIEPDPFGKFIDDLVANEHTEGHKIEVRRFSNAEEAATAQMLFIPHSAISRAPSILAAIGNKPVLTVCEASGHATGTHGCTIALVNKDGAVRIRVNLERTRKAGVVISSKVLRFAEIIDPK